MIRSRIKKLIQTNITDILIWGVAFIALALTCWFRFDYLMDSDMASELVLSELLAKENAIVSPNWYYSTEIKFFSVQIIYMLLFKVFHDWTVIRTGAVMIMYVMIAGSVYYFLKQFRRSDFWGITAALFLLPVSDVYFKMVLCGAYYIPYVVFGVLTIALVEHYIHSGKRFLMVCVWILALLSGMGGIRPIAILYAPLGLESLIMLVKRLKENRLLLQEKTVFQDREIRAYLGVGVSGAIALAGFGINHYVLSRYLTWGVWKQVSGLTGFSIRRFGNVLWAILECFGTDMEGKPFGMVCVLTGVLWGIYTLYTLTCWIFRSEDRAKQRIALFVAISYMIFLLLFLFTDMHLESRYFLSIIIFSFLIWAIEFGEKRAVRKQWLRIGLIILTFLSGIIVYWNIWQDRSANDHMTIVHFLQEEEVYDGYATFWNANILTDLSNGKIEVWSWANSYGGGKTLMNTVDDINPWLQLKSNTTEVPEGRVFVLFTEGEYQELKWKEQLEQISPALNIQGAYRVWIFEDYEEMKNVLSEGN